MIGRMDRDLLSAVVTTLRVSLTSTAIAASLALPLGFLMARFNFRGKRAVLNLLRTALALPTVVVGLFVYAFIARNTPLGELGLLFTPTAIVMGQVLLIIPLITALVHSAVQGTVHPVYQEALLLGASPLQASVKSLIESRLPVTDGGHDGLRPRHLRGRHLPGAGRQYSRRDPHHHHRHHSGDQPG